MDSYAAPPMHSPEPQAFMKTGHPLLDERQDTDRDTLAYRDKLQAGDLTSGLSGSVRSAAAPTSVSLAAASAALDRKSALSQSAPLTYPVDYHLTTVPVRLQTQSVPSTGAPLSQPHLPSSSSPSQKAPLGSSAYASPMDSESSPTDISKLHRVSACSSSASAVANASSPNNGTCKSTGPLNNSASTTTVGVPTTISSTAVIYPWMKRVHSKGMRRYYFFKVSHQYAFGLIGIIRNLWLLMKAIKSDLPYAVCF
ncbi:unnamed protein product [Dibothriocephalus latus]|uniref:Homeobox domain-containing protein n=1 Tax=Dibothriocephalus latus TaxID=60516 RepID=A0A3P6TY51_DIBLA|nr:unnamed protein product [Dibothriocephalus latus]